VTFHSINFYMDLIINTRGMNMFLVKGPVQTTFINFNGHHVVHCLELGFTCCNLMYTNITSLPKIHSNGLLTIWFKVGI
jgi:hypothetical protein